VIIVLFCLLIQMRSGQFFTGNNLVDIIRSFSIPVMFCVGELMVLISGGVDCSFPAIASMSMFVVCKYMENVTTNPLPFFIVAALIGLFTGKLSEGLMIGVVYIKIIMLVFIAVPILCALIGVSGLSAVLCNLVPSQPAFDGIMALSAGNTGAAIKDAGILSIHCVVWPALYVLLFTQRKKQGGYSI